MDAYVDPLAAICTWVNASPVVGAGRALEGGMHPERHRSPGQGAYAYVTWIASPQETTEAPIHNALLSASVYGMTEPNARQGAIALANLLRRLDGTPVVVGAAVLLCVETITGPSRLPGTGEYGYLVDALVNLEPT